MPYQDVPGFLRIVRKEPLQVSRKYTGRNGKNECSDQLLEECRIKKSYIRSNPDRLMIADWDCFYYTSPFVPVTPNMHILHQDYAIDLGQMVARMFK